MSGEHKKSENAQPEAFPKLTLPLLYILAYRSVLFFASLLGALFLLYGVGNFQQFTDENQLLILRAAVIVAELLSLFSIIGIGVSLVFFVRGTSVRHHIAYGLRALLLLALFTAGIAGMFFSRAVIVLAR